MGLPTRPSNVPRYLSQRNDLIAPHVLRIQGLFTRLRVVRFGPPDVRISSYSRFTAEVAAAVGPESWAGGLPQERALAVAPVRRVLMALDDG